MDLCKGKRSGRGGEEEEEGKRSGRGEGEEQMGRGR